MSKERKSIYRTDTMKLYLYNNFKSHYVAAAKYDLVFVSGKWFQTNLIFESETGTCLSGGALCVVPLHG
jgi:hypothetical protein